MREVALPEVAARVHWEAGEYLVSLVERKPLSAELLSRSRDGSMKAPGAAAAMSKAVPVAPVKAAAATIKIVVPVEGVARATIDIVLPTEATAPAASKPAAPGKAAMATASKAAIPAKAPVAAASEPAVPMKVPAAAASKPVVSVNTAAPSASKPAVSVKAPQAAASEAAVAMNTAAPAASKPAVPMEAAASPIEARIKIHYEAGEYQVNILVNTASATPPGSSTDSQKASPPPIVQPAATKRATAEGNSSGLGLTIPGSADWFFSNADTDRNGSIDVKELYAVFEANGLEGGDVEDIFSKCDTSADGMINREEWRAGFHVHMAELAATNDDMQTAAELQAPPGLGRRRQNTTVRNGVPVLIIPAFDELPAAEMREEVQLKRAGASIIKDGSAELARAKPQEGEWMGGQALLDLDGGDTIRRPLPCLKLYAYAAQVDGETWKTAGMERQLVVPTDGKTLVLEVDGRCTLYIRDGVPIVFAPRETDAPPEVTRTDAVAATAAPSAVSSVKPASASASERTVSSSAAATIPSGTALAAAIATPTASQAKEDSSTTALPDAIDPPAWAGPTINVKVGEKANVEKSLVLRSLCELYSPKICDVKAGTTVYVLELAHESNGAQRVKIALGDVACNRGWVTAFSKDDGAETLKAIGNALEIDCSAQAENGAAELEAAAQSQEPVVPSLQLAAATVPESAAAAASTAAAMSGKVGKESHRGPKSSARGAPKSSARGTAAPSHRGSKPPSSGKAAVSSRSPPGKDKGDKKSSEKAEKRAAADKLKNKVPDDVMASLLPVAVLHSQAVEKLVDASEACAKAERGGSGLLERLGIVLATKAMTVADLVQQWDTNRDGVISKGEFRAAIRSSLGLKADSKEIETVFDLLDEDGGGTLDTGELKVGLLKLMDAAEKSREADQALRAQAARHRQRASALTLAAANMEAVVAEEMRLAQLRRPVSVRLGDVITNKTKGGSKIKDLTSSWDPSISPQQPEGKGLVKQQFRQMALSYLQAAEGEGTAERPAASSAGAAKDEEDERIEIDAYFETLLEEVQATKKGAQTASAPPPVVGGPPRLSVAPAIKLMLEASQRQKIEDEHLFTTLIDLKAKAGQKQHALRLEAEAERLAAEKGVEALTEKDMEAMRVKAAKEKAKAEAEQREKADFAKRVSSKRKGSLALVTAGKEDEILAAAGSKSPVSDPSTSPGPSSHRRTSATGRERRMTKEGKE